MAGKARALGVRMNGYAVGVLTKDAGGGVAFRYGSGWLNTPGARPISLSMPLRHQAYQGEIVFNFFDNLLPDNRSIRDRIQARFRVTSSHPFDLLEAIGAECVGALQIAPEEAPTMDVRRIDGEPLSDAQIARLLGSYRTAPLGMARDGFDEFRISIAGAQEKTALLWHDGGWQRPLGPTPTTHILKLPMGRLEHSGMDLSDSCENEWLCLKIAEGFGLPVCDTAVQQFEGVKALVVERFDRRRAQGWIMRLPQEDMCQALGYSPNLKYESDGGPGVVEIMRLLRQSRAAKVDRERFFQSLILFWLLAAIDGHAKNFSLFIEPAGRYRLTPLYDVMSAYPLLAKRQLEPQKIKMAMGLQSKNRHYRWHTLKPRHFFATAVQAGLPEASARRQLDGMLSAVETAIAHASRQMPADFPEEIADPIFAGMRERARTANPCT